MSSTSNSRTKARKRALDILFEAELRGNDPLDTLAERIADADPVVRDYTAEIVRGVSTDLDQLDVRISAACAKGWTLHRMPRVDRALARIALWEADQGLDPRIAISQAQLLAGELSTDDSPTFLGGLLGTAIGAR
ncbi:transcription antitermination factor NusB [Enemella sp. A6]|uniref:transcription antitermination factor NusB n=1 Tax=Enemella sp. A6 TaxID=3440152 RepID=UPI003EBEF26B